jgi:tetratricopeptide (TPR) repeat protein
VYNIFRPANPEPEAIEFAGNYKGNAMNLKSWRLFVVLVAFSLIAPGLARAQDQGTTVKMLNTGFNLLEAGNYEQAQKVYEEVLKKDPTQPLALNNLAAIMVKHGRYDEALGYLNRALPRAKGFKVAINRVCSIDSVCAASLVNEKGFGTENLDRVVRSNILMVKMAQSAKPGPKESGTR